MNIYEKLLAIQSKLKAPKDQYNEFGKYKYRNCEDILEAVKPLCVEAKAVVFIFDEIVPANERIYVKATATFLNLEKTDEKIVVTAFAREEETKKGMDGSQITGASSSYARKYALNGLFAIDDTKDSDTTNKHDDKPTAPKNATQQAKPTADEVKDLYTIASQWTFKGGKNAGKKIGELSESDLKYFMTIDNQIISKYATIVWEHDFKDISSEIKSEVEVETPPMTDDDIPFQPMKATAKYKRASIDFESGGVELHPLFPQYRRHRQHKEVWRQTTDS